MSTLETLKRRLVYHGGDSNSRLERDKLRSLNSALQNSYQSETIILEDYREFKCLINPDKLHPEYDNKILSIPYRAKSLNSDYLEEESLHLKSGDTFTWKETNTHWLIYLPYLEETAYFRAEIRLCTNKIMINDHPYWVYIRGPVETTIPWNQKGGVEWNDINASLVMFIKRNQETSDYFHRFKKIKIEDPNTHKMQTWKVVSQNGYYGKGIIQVFLDEDFENIYQDELDKQNANKKEPEIDYNKSYIEGPYEVKKYDTVSYTVQNFNGLGTWYVIYKDKTYCLNNTEKTLTIDINKSRGSFILQYKNQNEFAELQIQIRAI